MCRKVPRVRIPPAPGKSSVLEVNVCFFDSHLVVQLERCERGRIGLPAKELYLTRVPRVRIPPAPKKKLRLWLSWIEQQIADLQVARSNRVSLIMKSSITQVLFALALVFLFPACATRANLSDDLTPAQLIQRAQEASDRNRYNAALQYFEALQDRFSHNIDLVITAEYGIAFIHFRQRNFQQAREKMNALLERYNSPDAVWLPQQYRRLAEIVLARIDEIESQRRGRRHR